MQLLALDPSTAATGWACSDGAGGVYRPAPPRGSSMTPDAKKAYTAGRFSSWLSDKLTETEAEIVVCERGGAPGRGSHMELLALVAALCYLRERAFVTVHPSTWQAWVRRQDWARHYRKSDLNDAYAMLLWAHDTLPWVSE